ncbi:hypothetical protein OSTOST_01129 [Ostertagia ostertagi]
MNLRDYLSNSVVVNKNIMDSDRANSTEIKVLGIHWNTVEDITTLKFSKKQVNKISKRTDLGQISGYCYDPLRLLTFQLPLRRQCATRRKECKRINSEIR